MGNQDKIATFGSSTIDLTERVPSAVGYRVWAALREGDEVQFAEVPASPEELIVGRGSQAELVSTDPGISRRHLAFRCDPELTVRVESTAGCVLNGEPLGPGAERAVGLGSELKIGTSTVKVYAPLLAGGQQVLPEVARHILRLPGPLACVLRSAVFGPGIGVEQILARVSAVEHIVRFLCFAAIGGMTGIEALSAAGPTLKDVRGNWSLGSWHAVGKRCANAGIAHPVVARALEAAPWAAWQQLIEVRNRVVHGSTYASFSDLEIVEDAFLATLEIVEPLAVIPFYPEKPPTPPRPTSLRALARPSDWPWSRGQVQGFTIASRPAGMLLLACGGLELGGTQVASGYLVARSPTPGKLDRSEYDLIRVFPPEVDDGPESAA
jgi:hypothetical protein